MGSDPLNRLHPWNPYHPSSLWQVGLLLGGHSTRALPGPQRETGEHSAITPIEKRHERRPVV